MCYKLTVLIMAILFVCPSFTHAQSKLWDETSNEQERSRLYTKPDPSATGGIRGVVTNIEEPISQALAVNQDEPGMVYKAEVFGPNKREFSFNGLPSQKYDIILIFKSRFFEGLALYRGESTLTKTDTDNIAKSIQQSEPFWSVKTVHRVEGETGRGNLARAICTYLRNKQSLVYAGPVDDYRRTFKLVMLKDVGPGWQIIRARDLYPLWVIPQDASCVHHFSNSLQGIRVTNKIKNLGEINL